MFAKVFPIFSNSNRQFSKNLQVITALQILLEAGRKVTLLNHFLEASKIIFRNTFLGEKFSFLVVQNFTIFLLCVVGGVC
jgi:hypothetical protein